MIIEKTEEIPGARVADLVTLYTAESHAKYFRAIQKYSSWEKNGNTIKVSYPGGSYGPFTYTVHLEVVPEEVSPEKARIHYRSASSKLLSTRGTWTFTQRPAGALVELRKELTPGGWLPGFVPIRNIVAARLDAVFDDLRRFFRP